MKKKSPPRPKSGLSFFKIIFLCFLAGIIVGSAFIYKKFTSTPEMIYPFPYIVEDTEKLKNPGQDLTKAHLLILGDENAKALAPLFPPLIKNLSQGLKAPLSVLNWGKDGLGIHHQLAQIKNLPSLPPIVIYQAGNSEFFEKKLALVDEKLIRLNLKYSDDPRLLSAIMSYPPLSRLIYKTVHYQKLKALRPQKDLTNYGPSSLPKKIILGLEIYKRELQYLNDLVEGHGRRLVLITAPINLTRPIEKVCEISDSDLIKQRQNEIESQINSGDLKGAILALTQLSETAPANAKTFFLLGQTALKNGDEDMAKKALIKAHAFDCGAQNKSNLLINSIVRETAQKNNIPLIDFERLLTDELQNTSNLFATDHDPSALGHQLLMAQIENLLKEHFRL